MDKSLRLNFTQIGYYKYTIDSMTCGVLSNTKNCTLNSSIDFKTLILYDSEIMNARNALIFSPNMTFANIINFLKTASPLSNETFVKDASGLLNIKKEETLLRVKTSGNLEYGVSCIANEQCDTNMFCIKRLNDALKICRCIDDNIAIFNRKTGHYECGNFFSQ
jgi:hypothetical protein